MRLSILSALIFLSTFAFSTDLLPAKQIIKTKIKSIAIETVTKQAGPGVKKAIITLDQHIPNDEAVYYFSIKGKQHTLYREPERPADIVNDPVKLASSRAINKIELIWHPYFRGFEPDDLKVGLPITFEIFAYKAQAIEAKEYPKSWAIKFNKFFPGSFSANVYSNCGNGLKLIRGNIGMAYGEPTNSIFFNKDDLKYAGCENIKDLVNTELEFSLNGANSWLLKNWF
jgi:hypothetical protein